MRTITIQIGNSDDKLSQREWYKFVISVRKLISVYCNAIHFFGAPANWESWQNVAWIITCDDNRVEALKTAVAEVRAEFNQDSAAWTEGETEFV
jgi:hypothetical protein